MGIKVCAVTGYKPPPVWAVCGWWCKPSLVGRVCRRKPVAAPHFAGVAAICDFSTALRAGELCPVPGVVEPAAFFQLRALAIAAQEVVDRSDADDAVRTMFRFLRLWPFRWEAQGEQPVTQDATAAMDPPPVGGYIDFFF
jgi:hypothetical protein